MATITPKRPARAPHIHTPKMSDRKKGLFQSELEATRESLTAHRQLPVVDSESDNEVCDLGIISALDSSSSCDENDSNAPKTPERRLWRKLLSLLCCILFLKFNHYHRNIIHLYQILSFVKVV